MSPCYPFRPIPGQCGPHKCGPSPAPPFNPQDYWATRKLVSSLFGTLDTTKLDKVDVVDPSTATEDGKAAEAKSTYKELTRISGVASDALVLAESKADKATTLAGYGITDAATKIDLASKADLVDGKVPAAQLPSFVDDVLEYDAMSSFPATGEDGKIYIDKETNKTYRWSGTQYIEISQSLALGETESTAYPGNKGKAATETAEAAYGVANSTARAIVTHTENKSNPHAVTAAQVGAVPLVEDASGEKTAVTIGSRKDGERVGAYSFANGSGVTASFPHSHAEGGGTTACGDYSHAEGGGTIASGHFSHAEGVGTTAAGEESHAEGSNTIASGIGSHTDGISSLTRSGDQFAFAWNGDYERPSPYTSHGPGTYNINPIGGLNGFYIGEQTLSAILANKANKSALDAHVENNNNPHAVTAAQVGAVPLVEDASGNKTAVTIGSRKDGERVGKYSFANGSDVTASGYLSHAEGGGTTASGDYSHAEGNGTTASGINSHAEGESTTASEAGSHAEGAATTASGHNSHAEGNGTTASGINSHAEGESTTASKAGSHAEGGVTTASGVCAHAEGYNTTASGEYSHAEGGTTESGGRLSHAEGSNAGAVGDYSHAEGSYTTASGKCSHAEGNGTTASGENSHAEGAGATASGIGSHAEGAGATASGDFSHVEGVMSQTLSGHNFAYVWNGDAEREAPYDSHGAGTFNINPAGGLNGFFIGEQTLPQVINAAIAGKANLAALAPEYSATSAYSVGAIVYHNDNIYQCKTAIADGGEAWNSEKWELRKLDDFFTESNSLLTGIIAAKSIPAFSSLSTYEVGEIVIYGGVAYKCVTAITPAEEWTAAHWTLATNSDLAARLKGLKSDGTATASFVTSILGNPVAKEAIDEEIIEKGTSPDAHLEAPTDERLKLVLADNSVAYDSAKALPYKLTSAIGDRVIATMTLTAASTDITLPTISANDTTVKDFILDVTNAYAVEGVATDAGINIPRTDFKLVTRDGESLTDVTTVKAGKSAFICFTQKSPVVVDGTTYPCWCVIQLPFGDPS